MALFSQEHGLVPLCALATSVTSSADLDSINMALYDHATILIIHSASVVGDNVLYAYGGATDGTKTAALTFHYRVGSAAPKSATADVLAADATSAALTLTAASYQGLMLVLEISADEMQASGTQYQFLTINFDGTASTGTIAAFAILSKPRYARAVMPTAIPTS